MPPPLPPMVKAGADDEREGADAVGDLARLLQRVRRAGNRHVEADALHRLLEKLPVLALLDRLRVGADHLHVVLAQGAGIVERHGGVERGLAAEGGQQRVGPLAHDDLLHDLRRDRLDVGAVRELRVGHDRGRVGVDQDDAVALLAQGFAGLDAGVVELAGLADDDRPRADEEDGFEVSTLGHERRAPARRVGSTYKPQAARGNADFCDDFSSFAVPGAIA